MGVKQQISFIKSCYVLDEVDRCDVMETYVHDIEVFIYFASPLTLPFPSSANYNYYLSIPLLDYSHY